MEVTMKDVAAYYGLKPDRHKMCLCCLHDENRPSMSLDLDKGVWHCFSCGKGGGPVKLVMEKEGLGYREACKWIGENIRHQTCEEDGHREKEVKRSFVDWGYLERSRSNDSDFCRALVGAGILTQEQMERAAERYMLGRNSRGGVIFWQVDEERRVHDGKIMYYAADCHRERGMDKHPNWVSSCLRQRKMFDGQSVQCLFGLHLLVEGKAIGVVESEKTAVICSEVYPEYIWMATGGFGNYNECLMRPLKGRMVTVFPDTDVEGRCYREWRERVEGVFVSGYLERLASEEQKRRKIDLADYVIEFVKTVNDR